jgi:hypothetical protein
MRCHPYVQRDIYIGTSRARHVFFITQPHYQSLSIFKHSRELHYYKTIFLGFQASIYTPLSETNDTRHKVDFIIVFPNFSGGGMGGRGGFGGSGTGMGSRGGFSGFRGGMGLRGGFGGGMDMGVADDCGR